MIVHKSSISGSRGISDMNMHFGCNDDRILRPTDIGC